MTVSDIHILPFGTDDGIGTVARLGLVVLQSDQTVEQEAAQIIHHNGVDGTIGLYHSRIPNETEITPNSLNQMAKALPQSAALLPREFDFDVIGYGCTSGATIIGENEVDTLIKTVHPNALTTNPITACKAALSACQVHKIALVTPYAVAVTKAMQDNLTQAGFAITKVASFNQSDDFTVARITAAAIYDAVLEIGAQPDTEAVFISCTSLRALPIIAKAEAVLGKPVLSSNQVFIWHMMRLAGMTDRRADFGQLFDKQLGL